MKISYVRVSTREQNTARREELKSPGVKKVYIDRMSVKNTERPALQEIMGFVCAGDTVPREKHFKICKEYKKYTGTYKDEYIFKWEGGRIYDPDYITKLSKKAVQCPTAGLFTDCATATVQSCLKKLGSWKNPELTWTQCIAVTANIYNHVSKKWRNKHRKMIDEMFK